MGKFDEKRRCPPNGGAAHIREQTLPPLAKSRGYAPGVCVYLCICLFECRVIIDI